MIVNRVKFRKGTYRSWKALNPIPGDAEIILVTEIPGWWRWRKTRLKIGDGKTCFNKLRYI